MSDESQESHQSGLLYFMPAWIFESHELSNTEKLVYSLLSGLAYGNEEKTCFPSDAYIGKRLGIGRQAANDCVSSLEKIGAISKITVKHENNPFRNKRIITVYLYPQKIFTKSQKDDSRQSQKYDSTVSQKDDSSNKEYSNKESLSKERDRGQAPKPPRAPNVTTSEEEHQRLIKDFGEEATQMAYKHLSEWKDDVPKVRWRKSDNLAIRRWVMDALKKKGVKFTKGNNEKPKGNAEEWLKRRTQSKDT